MAQLKARLRTRGRPIYGSKGTLIARLQKSDKKDTSSATGAEAKPQTGDACAVAGDPCARGLDSQAGHNMAMPVD